jgi:hypothetical protein
MGPFPLLRVQFDGLIVVGHRSVQVALPLLDISPVVVGGSKLRIEPDGLIVSQPSLRSDCPSHT